MKQLNLYYLGGGGPSPTVPDGKTITPINDVTIWQQCAGLQPVYSTLSEILADSGYACALMSNDNAVDYMIRSTAWIIKEVPAMTNLTTPSGEVTASTYETGNYAPWKAFARLNDSNGSGWIPTTSDSIGEAYVQYEYANSAPVEVVQIYIKKWDSGSGRTFKYKLCGSNDGENFTDILTDITLTSNESKTINLNNTATYRYHRVYVTYANGGTNPALARGVELQFYSSNIPDSEIAMQAIGASDYASTQVLSNNTWCEAICKSDYCESVINIKVPTMTSNTDPSGLAFAGNSYSEYQPWRAFRNVNDVYGMWESNSIANNYIGYQFTENHHIYAMSIVCQNIESITNRGIKDFRLQGSDDRNTWIDIGITRTLNQTTSKQVIPISENNNYSAFRVFIVNNYGASYVDIRFLQFYGRQIGGIQTWLKAAGINKPYTNMAQVFADPTTLSALMSSTAAVNYLVTAKAWINDICSNELAMQYIGANNYAANTLLADSDWCNGICNSTYFESVLNVKVPVMTSNTTPSGECFASSVNSSYPIWKAFDGNNSTAWSPSSASVPQYIGYKFTSAIRIYSALIRPDANSTGSSVRDFIVQASNDDNTWTDLYTDYCPYETSSTDHLFSFASNADYQEYRIYISSKNGSWPGGTSVATLQFYGREDV